MAAVIFDLDGVLVDSEPIWSDAYARFVAERYGAHLAASEAQRFEGGRVFETVENLMVTFGEVDRAEARSQAGPIADALIEHVAEWFRVEGRLIASSVTTLAGLHEEGVHVGVASSSQLGFIDAVLDRSGVRHLVEVVVSAYELQRGKPHPDVYEIASRQLRVPPEDGVAVEDSENGVRSALAAGLSCVCLWRKGVPPPAWIVADCAVVVDELTPAVVSSGLRPRRTPPVAEARGVAP